MRNQRNGRQLFWRYGCILAATVAVLLAGIGVGLSLLYTIPPYLIVAIAGGTYILLVGVYFFVFHRFSASDPAEMSGDTAEALTAVMYTVEMPAVLCKKNGRILWCNDAFVRVLGKRGILTGELLERVAGVRLGDMHLAEESREKDTILLGDKLYETEMHVAGASREERFIVFRDSTELLSLKRISHEQQTVVAYITVDNIEEILQFVQERFRRSASDVEELLRKWVEDMDGIFRSYEKNKYFALFSAEAAEKMVENRFSILDEIRNIRVGDGISITVSIGIANVSGTLAEREKVAENALDLALQRGGDQVVYRTDTGTDFYGGKTKSIYKRASVRARVIAGQIASLIGRSDNVLIMGHRFGDFDSIASAVGMARFAMHCGAKVNIVVNFSDPNIRSSVERMQEVEEFRDVFIDGPGGLDRIRPDTLLIVVDVNNFEHVESPAILRNVSNVVVVDHHRKTADSPISPLVTYIEPSASSASELVAEMLEQVLSGKSLTKEEAELLLSGILLDTQQFTRNTGTRTFAAALYLRGEGADPSETNEFFKSEMDDVVKEAKFHSHVHIYRENIAITVCAEDADASYRVVAAKAANKLLQVKDVEASFALVKIDGRVHISARSAGKINVQLILEKLNGGGHFDVAGAQVESSSSHAVVERLKDAIDTYFEEDYEQKETPVEAAE